MAVPISMAERPQMWLRSLALMKKDNREKCHHEPGHACLALQTSVVRNVPQCLGLNGLTSLLGGLLNLKTKGLEAVKAYRPLTVEGSNVLRAGTVLIAATIEQRNAESFPETLGDHVEGGVPMEGTQTPGPE
ncbi:hypothetical protein CMUS01_14613 [Colletotrichum musicola]|uniref:Uncharacterized protein n=1 Tax=Colletotrichum musicola TaxID=2175873 RepID=A0A8H6J3K0_9PEZI|nr:hypothetical protein CMUS01_14613 [Colletotrichum musicola]